MKRVLILVLIGLILISNMAMAASNHVMEYKDLDKEMTRKELATVGVRLKDLEHLAQFYEDKETFLDVKGWATPYINLAYSFDIMKGITNHKFEPDASVRYIELLTVIMRVMGYVDGIDFVKYPEDYYNKALELGLANMYIPYDQVVTRGLAYDMITEVFMK